MSNHTPTPWTIEYDHATNTPEFIRAPFDGEMLDVASVLCSETGNLEADARLISAAPDLLAAIKDMTDAFGHYCEGDPSDDEVAALNRAMGAINKATGIRA